MLLLTCDSYAYLCAYCQPHATALRSPPHDLSSLPPLVPKVSVVEAIKEEGGEDAFDSPREIEAVLA